MAFTAAEKNAWAAGRKAGRSDDDFIGDVNICGHCSNPFTPGAGVVTQDFALCDVCNGD